MLSFSPLTRQLLADDFAIAVWLLDFIVDDQDPEFYSSFPERIELAGGDLVYLPIKFVRIIPPATKNLTDGIQPYAEVSVQDANRKLYGDREERQGGGATTFHRVLSASLNLVMINGEDTSEFINVASGLIRNKTWANGIYTFRILNFLDLSKSNPIELSATYQNRIDPSDTAFDGQRLSFADWRP